MPNEQSRVAIVTGASKGIGAAIAQTLANDGMRVVVAYGSDKAAAEDVVGSILADGGQAVAIQTDIGAPDGMTKLFSDAETAFGSVDVLVNNAGIMALSPVAQVDDDAFARQVNVNLGGTFRGIREGARRLRENGRIINISTSVVGLYQPGYGVYAATKAGIEAMTHIAAKELGAKRITVNAVAPGPVETQLFLTGKSDEQLAAIAKMTPMGRLGQPDDIASVVAFLASPQGGWVNGQTIRANGGVV